MNAVICDKCETVVKDYRYITYAPQASINDPAAIRGHGFHLCENCDAILQNEFLAAIASLRNSNVLV